MVHIKRIAAAQAVGLQFGGRNRLDLVGQRFGMLTVIAEAPRGPRYLSNFVCRCDCGVEKVIVGSELTRKSRPRRSCGCLVRTNAIGKPSHHRLDLVGKTFGRLTVVAFAGVLVTGSGHRYSTWRCRCVCGGEKITGAGNLQKGRVQSCGCLNQEQRRNRPPLGQEVFVERFWSHIVCELKTGCWLWTGGSFHSGYGRLYARGQNWLAHRFSYALLVGPLEEDHVLDHLCRTRLCVRPEHLEQVTSLENYLRAPHCPTCTCEGRDLTRTPLSQGEM